MLGGDVVFALQRGPEIGRIVGIERHLATRRLQRRERMVGKAVEHLQRDVGAGAAFEHHALVGDALDEIRVFDGADAVADARRLDVVERGLDALPAHQFAGMDRDAEACLARDLEGTHIVLEVAHPLVAGDAEAGHQRMSAAGREPRRLLDRFDADMAHARHDHAALDAGLGLGARHALAERVGVGLRRQARFGRMIRRGEDLGIDRPIAGEAGQIVVGEPRIVLLGAEKVGGEVVGGEKTGEIVPDEGAVLDVGRDVPAVFPGLRDHEFGRCRAFDVAVQFRFQRHSLILVVPAARRGRTPRPRP